MNVIFTGSITTNDELKNILLDGELINKDTNNDYINLFACFDIYFIGGKDVRNFKFSLNSTIPNNEKGPKENSRLSILKDVIVNLNPISVVSNASTPIRIESKEFYSINNHSSIFKSCKYILQKQHLHEFEYNTDGLIFTHMLYGVGGNEINQTGPNKKITWTHSFKWKPQEYNTIDFLISTIKENDGNDKIIPVFNDGNTITEYKRVELRCTFIENDPRHGYINPCKNVFENIMPKFKENKTRLDYIPKPVRFYPTEPSDESAGLCNILLQEDENGVKQMFTDDEDNKELIQDNTIVEFKYNLSKDGLFRWTPIRVRHDKTADMRNGSNNFGNAYHVANSNWHSIHTPVTIEMITEDKDIPVDYTNNDVYYNANSSVKTNTRPLRDFHNLFIKKELIKTVSPVGGTLIDFACGKGGDFPKWINAKYSFVLGIDISKDNIENRIDGACARFLNYNKTTKNVPRALFIHGDSRYNIKDGSGIKNEKSINIIKQIFGTSKKDKTLGDGVINQYGVGRDGFDVSSCQFALHYFFESIEILNNFVKNVSECTKIGGYFIGTSYNGKIVYNKLSKISKNETITKEIDGKVVWKITKKYSQTEFKDDNSSVGYKIDVFQESINKTFSEYLVNYDYFDRIMINAGFALITNKEFNNNLNGRDNFKVLYNKLINITNTDNNIPEFGEGMNMTPTEKEISFLNNYFIYKKINNINDMTHIMPTTEDVIS
jgi:hypothetical protein